MADAACMLILMIGNDGVSFDDMTSISSSHLAAWGRSTLPLTHHDLVSSLGRE